MSLAALLQVAVSGLVLVPHVECSSLHTEHLDHLDSLRDTLLEVGSVVTLVFIFACLFVCRQGLTL